MMKKAAQIVIVFFLITAFVFNLFIVGLFAQPAELKAVNQLSQAEKAPPAEVIVRPSIEYDAENLRDPFENPVLVEKPGSAAKTEVSPQPRAEEPPPALRIQGLIWGGNFPQAIVNNKVVKVGDTIEGAKITYIGKEGIIVFFKDREYNFSSPAATAAKPAAKAQQKP